MSDTLPMFPLNTVLFPGVSVPLHVFEDRYRALVHHLLRVDGPGRAGVRLGRRSARATRSATTAPSRCTGSAAGSSSPTSRRNDDGTFDIVAVGLRADPARAAGRPAARSPSAHVDATSRRRAATVPEEVVERARATFTAYRAALGDDARRPVLPAPSPRDPTYLSWTPGRPRAAADARAPGAARGRGRRASRLVLVTDLLRDELRAMNVDPVAAGHRGGPHPLVAQLSDADGEEEGAAGGTPATRRADAGPGSTFTLHDYEHDPRAASYGLEAAEALGVDPARVFKTLMATVDGALVVGIVPVAGQLDLKALARALGGSKAVMAEVAAAERATGYVAGGISPIGQKRAHPTVLDEIGARPRDGLRLGRPARPRPGLAPADLVGSPRRSRTGRPGLQRCGQSVVTRSTHVDGVVRRASR